MSDKLLVADDDRTLRMLMREILEANFNVEVVEAGDGLEAWNMLNAGLVACVCILDVRMPKMDGLSLLAKLRGDPRFKHQKVMLCSTVNSRATILEAARMHVDAFLLKPFKADEFLTHVQSLLQKPAADARPCLERTEEVLGRLGISIDVYRRLLTVLNDDIQSFVASCSTSSTITNDDFQLRVSAIKGATSSLGAVGLKNLFASLEQVKWFRSPEAQPILQGIEEERLRLAAATAGLEQTAGKF
jgi:two-component system chemotaxis response regulator CheY